MTGGRARALATAAVAAWSLAWATVAAAAALQVAPLRIELSPAQAITSLRVVNAEDTETTVQAELVEWTQEAGRDVFRPTRDVLVNPVIFRLPGKGSQIVRLGLQVPAAATERSYRIFIQQLPRDDVAPEGGGPLRMQTLLRLSLPVFVPAQAPRIEGQWRIGPGKAQAGGLVFENKGNTHIQVTRLRLQGDGAALIDRPMSFYVLAGQSAPPPIDLPALPSAARLRVETTTDASQPLPTTLLDLRDAASEAR